MGTALLRWFAVHRILPCENAEMLDLQKFSSAKIIHYMVCSGSSHHRYYRLTYPGLEMSVQSGLRGDLLL